jgi:hypothetical protein
MGWYNSLKRTFEARRDPVLHGMLAHRPSEVTGDAEPISVVRITSDSTFPGKVQDDDRQQNHQQRPNDHPATGPLSARELAYLIEDGRVILTKAPARTIRRNDPLEEPFATFWEWSSPEDAEDYADL